MSGGPGGRGAPRSRAVQRGLVHLGLLHDDPDDLVASALPAVRRAIADGDEVLLVVDRRTARTFREALGDDAEHVVFPPPSSMLPPSAPGFLATVQGWARADRRTTVLGQYPAAMPAPDCGFGEDALNLVLRDLPLTLICTCHRDLAPDLLAVARRTHPHLVTPDGRVDNPEFHTPPAADPVPADLWGAVAGRVGVDGAAGLAEVRQCVADVAERAGLQGDAVRAAVLAVHEAAVLACRTGDPVHAPLVLEVRARPGETLFSEVVGPPAAEESRGDGVDGADLLAHLRPFCTGAHLHDGPDGRAVRVLTTV